MAALAYDFQFGHFYNCLFSQNTKSYLTIHGLMVILGDVESFKSRIFSWCAPYSKTFCSNFDINEFDIDFSQLLKWFPSGATR